MYKKALSVLVILIAASTVAHSQTLGNNNGYQLDAYDVKGKVLTGAVKATEGSALLNPDWGTGMVKFKNGYWVKSMSLKFDLEKNELYFQKADMQLSFVDTVREFIINYNIDGNGAAAFFRSGYPAVARNTPETFYEVLSDGPKLQLIKYRTRIMLQRNNYGEGYTNYYKENTQLYWYQPSSGKIVKLKKVPDELVEDFPEFKAWVSEFQKNKQYRFRNDEELMELCLYINKK